MLLLPFPEHTKSSVYKAFISWNSFSAEQDQFNLAKLLTKDLPDNYTTSVLQHVVLDLSEEEMDSWQIEALPWLHFK